MPPRRTDPAALHWAAQRDDAAIARLLIAAGANVKAATRYNITPLWLACGNGDVAVVEALLEEPAPIRTRLPKKAKRR